jgi:predicted dehydrogenase
MAVRLGVIGCGDAFVRHYEPALAALTDVFELVAICDRDHARLKSIAARQSTRRARICGSLQELVSDVEIDACLNLTPPQAHASVTRELLARGVSVYSEKPLALKRVDGAAIVAQARGDVTLCCAPALMATARFRWIRALLAAGTLGEPTLAYASFGNLGPEHGRDFEGDPEAYHDASVGPLVDLGVYGIDVVVGLLGPCVGVGALVGPPGSHGTAPTHVLLELELECSAVAHVLASYGVGASRGPAFELHCREGTVSVGWPWSSSGPVDVYLSGRTRQGLEGWVENANTAPPNSCTATDLFQAGLAHFADVLSGSEKSLLPPSRALHVLDVVTAARQSTGERRLIDIGKDRR